LKLKLANTSLVVLTLLNIGGCASLSSPAVKTRSPSSIKLADECEFIRQALKDLPASGGEVVIPEGEYTCRSPVVLSRSNTGIKGEGDVTLRLADKINAPLIVMGNIETPPEPVENVSVTHLRLDGNKENQQSECWGGECDTGGTSVIRNNGISVRGVHNGLIKHVYIRNTRSGGVVTEKVCRGLVIDHLTSVENYFDGFAGYETEDSKITNTILSNNNAAGISIDIHFSRNHFKNLKIENNRDVGIFMRESNENIFEKVSISKGGNHGVFIARANEHDERTCASDNVFKDLSVVNSKGLGFRLNDICRGNTLTGTSTFIGNYAGACISKAPGAEIETQGEVICK
jgi:hypothetical protein